MSIGVGRMGKSTCNAPFSLIPESHTNAVCSLQSVHGIELEGSKATFHNSIVFCLWVWHLQSAGCASKVSPDKNEPCPRLAQKAIRALVTFPPITGIIEKAGQMLSYSSPPSPPYQDCCPWITYECSTPPLPPPESAYLQDNYEIFEGRISNLAFCMPPCRFWSSGIASLSALTIFILIISPLSAFKLCMCKHVFYTLYNCMQDI